MDLCTYVIELKCAGHCARPGLCGFLFWHETAIKLCRKGVVDFEQLAVIKKIVSYSHVGVKANKVFNNTKLYVI